MQDTKIETTHNKNHLRAPSFGYTFQLLIKIDLKLKNLSKKYSVEADRSSEAFLSTLSLMFSSFSAHFTQDILSPPLCFSFILCQIFLSYLCLTA